MKLTLLINLNNGNYFCCIMITYQFEHESVLLTITINGDSITKSFPEKKHNVNDESVGPDEITDVFDAKNNVFECSFVAQSHKTKKLFELIVKSTDLQKISNIFVIDPMIILDIIKDEPNTISIIVTEQREDHVIIEYVKHIFGRRIPLKFKIPEKQANRPEYQDIAGNQTYQKLMYQITKLQKSNNLLEEKVKVLENEIITIKSMFSRLYGNTMTDQSEMLKIRIECGYDINNDPNVDSIVKSYLMNFYGKSIDDVDLLRSNECNYIRELIRNGYCVTNPTIDSKLLGLDCKISPLVYYVVWNVRNTASMKSEKLFLLFKEVIRMITPNADFKRRYGEFGTIMEWLTKELLNTTSMYANQEQKDCLRIAIRFLSSIGA